MYRAIVLALFALGLVGHNSVSGHVATGNEVEVLDADFDDDGDVDAEDFATWTGGFGTGSTKAEGDADLDGDVDGDDFLVWQADYQVTPPDGGGSGVNGLPSSSLRLGASGATAAPEPASAVLLGAALLAGLGIARRRR